MADLETTQSKLRSTPTAGVSGEHSAYYRRLLSAGYKGYIQGSIGGGTLYGAIGLAIGAVVSAGIVVATGGAALSALWLVPALGASFGMYGAHTFADIGKTAAIIADSADTNEKRRYLLDRYYETNNEQEAQEIKRQLEEVHQQRQPEESFHWRPAVIGALIGVTIAVVAVALLTQGIAPHFLLEGFEILMHAMHIPFAAGSVMSGAAITAALPALTGLAAAGAAIGGLAGSVIGIDREHIRRWLDKAEYAVHETGKAESEIAVREQEVQRIVEAAKRGEALANRAPEASVEKIQVSESPRLTTPSLERSARPDPVSPETIAGIGRPTHQVRDAVLAERIAGMQQALQH